MFLQKDLKMISYSVIIRTLGNGGDKYRALMDSIVSQTVEPEEIIVVIPEGYDLDYECGRERIVYSTKGMVTQRAVGINTAKSEYILVVDDDVKFEPDFVESLYKFGSIHGLDCVLPMEGKAENGQSYTIDLRYPLSVRIRGAFTGQLFQSNRKSKYLDKITVTAGHKVYLKNNKLDNCYLCQTGNFQCFFIRTSIAESVRLEDESWLQQGVLSQYSAYDDSTFFYKLYLLGGKIAYSLRTRYIHLDAAAGRQAKSKVEQKRIRYYTIARNRTVFWYRFLFQPSNSFFRKLHVVLGGLYAFINYTLYSTIINLRPTYWTCISALFKGYTDALKTIKELNPNSLKYQDK